MAAKSTPTPESAAPKRARFVHLHCHSEYSALDGGSQIQSVRLDRAGKKEKFSPFADRVKELGMEHISLTDHGIMQGLPSFYEQMRAHGINPILGMEAYLTDDRFNRNQRETDTYHLTLLAETSEGYQNLCRLSSRAFIDGTVLTFGRPRARADYDLLERYHRGVICLTGCMAAPTMRRLFEGNLTAAQAEVERMIEIFGQRNVFGEVQNVGIVKGIPADSEVARLLGLRAVPAEEAALLEYDRDAITGPVAAFSQMDSNRALANICEKLGVKLVATGDVHYLREDDAIPHDAMICIGTNQIQRGRRKFSLLPKKYHMRSEQEMRDALPGFEEAIENTVEVAERCRADITFGKELLPRFPIPEGFDNSVEYLKHLCEQGMIRRYGPLAEQTEQQRSRLAEELETIIDMGFPDYFLIVWDLFNEARKRKIPYGPGRGSAAGSIVAYTLGITQYCPLEFDLLFERFLNPGRKSMPDIDMDFSPKRRQELIEYARQKYNDLAECETAVAQIITYSRFKAKGALKAASKVLAEPTEEARKDALRLGDRLAGFVPAKPPNLTLREAYKESDQLKKAFSSGGIQAEVIRQAQWLEGMISANSIHAAAVIIADHPLEEDLPLQQITRGGAPGPLHVQYDMGYSERIGLLKMDFLGLRNLDVIQDTLDRIRAVHGIDIPNLGYDLPLDDSKTYDLFARGETVGTFQFESGGMQQALREVKPTEFRDLVALVALYRPGPMDNIPTYAAVKHGRQEVSYLDRRLEDFLGETYGVIVYQEQAMEIAKGLAGFDRAGADDLRKAIGKKLRDKMDALRKPFYDGCRANGVSKDAIDWIWTTNEKSADYSFNKAHAVPYAGISYITGYLKANYPNEYMASLLSSVMDDKDKPRLYLTEAKRMGLTVLPPDINRSFSDFAVLENEETGKPEILFGLTAIKGVGTAVVSEIRTEREKNGPFTSMFDLIRRMPQLSRASVQNLVLAGAFDALRGSRRAMFDVAEESIRRIKREFAAAEKGFCVAIRRRAETSVHDGQESLFGEITRTGKVRLATWERRAIEGAARASWAARAPLSEREVREAAYAAMLRAETSAARSAIRRQLREQAALSQPDAAADIAAEEGGGPSEREIIESRAGEIVTRAIPRLREQAAKIAPAVTQHIAAEWQERDDAEMLDAAMEAETDPPLVAEEWDDLERLNRERSVLNIYVTGHPLDRDSHKWNHYVDEGLGLVSEKHEGKVLKVVGALVGLTQKPMRSGDIMRIAVLEDLTGSREVTIFPRTLEGGLEELLEIGQVLCFEVAVQEDTFKKQADETHDDDGGGEPAERMMKLTASRLYRWDPSRVRERTHTAVVDIEISEEHFTREWVARLREVCAEFPGDNPVRLMLGEKPYRTELRVRPCHELASAVKTLLISTQSPAETAAA
jgi:DNA polymerase-3 subunit alpha